MSEQSSLGQTEDEESLQKIIKKKKVEIGREKEENDVHCQEEILNEEDSIDGQKFETKNTFVKEIAQ